MIGLVAPEIMKDYACSDVEYTYELYPIFKSMLIKEQTEPAYRIDMGATIAVYDMQRRGIAVNKRKMLEDEATLIDIKRTAHDRINEIVHKEINPDSPEELIEAMNKEFGVSYQFFTEKGQLATSKSNLKLFASENPVVAEFIDMVLLFRKSAKVLSTYVYNTLGYVQDDGRVHADFNINPNEFDKGGTKTGRLSSANPNMQNIPKKVIKLTHPTTGIEYTFNPREYYVADEGYQFILNDYDAQEYSVLGHYSQDENYMDGLNAGLDIHKFTYSNMFKVPYDSVDSDMRMLGKIMGFSIVYQVGNVALAVSLGYKIKKELLDPATRFMYQKVPAFKYPPYKNPSMTLPATLELARLHYTNLIDEARKKEHELLNKADATDDDRVALGIIQKEIRETVELYADVQKGIEYYFDPYVLEGIAYAIDMKKQYFANFPKIKSLLDEIKKVAAKRMWVRTFYGRKRHIKDVKFAYAMPNAVIQGTCADVMKRKLYELWLYLLDYKSFLAISIHDEVGTMHYKPEKELVGAIKEILEDLPFRIKITVGTDVANDLGNKSTFSEEEDEDDEEYDENYV
jgi:DNA polymerase I-like protein with 3'-5' exonuclease and polymerase domains